MRSFKLDERFKIIIVRSLTPADQARNVDLLQENNCAASLAICVSTDTIMTSDAKRTPDAECVEGKVCTIEGNFFSQGKPCLCCRNKNFLPMLCRSSIRR